jgi:hypothetical protein
MKPPYVMPYLHLSRPPQWRPHGGEGVAKRSLKRISVNKNQL